MALIETEGIVLRSYSLAEADRIIVVFTRKVGVVRAIAHGARRLKSKFSGALEPFTIISMIYEEKEGRDLVILKSTEIRQSVFGVSHRAGIVPSMAHIAIKLLQFAPPHEPNEKLYRMMSAAVNAIQAEESDVEGIVRYFEIWLLKLSGFLPDLSSCSVCSKLLESTDEVFQDSDLRFECHKCSGGKGWHLGQGTQSLTTQILKRNPTEFAAWFKNVQPSDRRDLAALTKRFIERVLESGAEVTPALY